MIFLILLLLSLSMMLYGIVRFFIAKKLVHILWIPGAAIFYALGMLVLIWT